MKTNIRTILCCSFLLSCNHTYTEIPLVDLKGLDTSMKADYQQFAPVHGALFWYSGLPKNLWLFGDDQSSMATLVRHLFYVQEDGSFDKTRSPMYINYYFTPSDIGSLVAIIFKHKDDVRSLEAQLKEFILAITKTRTAEIKKAIIDSLNKTQDRLSASIKQAQEKIISQIPENARQRFLEFLSQGKTDKASFKTEMKKLKLDKKLQKTIEQRLQVPLNTRAKNQKQIDDESKSTDVANEFFLKDVGLKPDTKPNFVTAIVGALAEEKQKVFPDGTVDNFLLALLWKLGDSRHDAKMCLEGFAKEMNLPAQEVFIWQEVTPYDADYYEHLKTKSEQEIMTMNLADLIFARYGFDYYENTLPPLVGMIAKVHYKNPKTNQIIEFSDCGETSLRNFINVLLYDSDKHIFYSTPLEKLSENPSPLLIAYYKKYNAPEYILTNQAHDDWAQVVSNLPGVLYGNQGCNISSDMGMKNMLAVINNLLPGIDSWQTLEERIRNLGFEISITPEKPLEQQPIHNMLTINLTKPDGRAAVLTWNFSSGHFDLEYTSDVQIKHAKLYLQTLKKRIDAIPINKIAQRWPLIMMYEAFGGGPNIIDMTSNSNMSYCTVLLPQAVTPEKQIDLAVKSLIALNQEANAIVQKYLCSLVLNVYKKLPKDDGILNQFFRSTLTQQIPTDPETINFVKTLFDIAKQHLSSIHTESVKVEMIKSILSSTIPTTEKAQDLRSHLIMQAINLLSTLRPESQFSMVEFIAHMKIPSDKDEHQFMKPIFKAGADLIASTQRDETKVSLLYRLTTVNIPSYDGAELLKPLFEAVANSLKTIKEDNVKAQIMLWLYDMNIPANKQSVETIEPIFTESAKLFLTIKDDLAKELVISRITFRSIPENKDAQKLVKSLFEVAAELLISIKDSEEKQHAVDRIKNMKIPSDPQAREIANILREAAGFK